MKIAVTATGPSLDDHVEPRFGRCPYFLIIETDTMEVEAMENPNIALGGGAGIQSAQIMAQKEVRTVLTGNCGPNAFRTLAAAGIQVIVGVSGVVREAVERFKSGAYTASPDANVASHFGMGAGAAGGAPGQGMDLGMGMGGGRGMGMGGGRGMGMGRRMAAGGAVPPPVNAQPGAPQGLAGDDLASLKAYAESMAKQLAAINARIADLETAGQASPLVAVVDEEKCVGCGICAQSCPNAAITVDDVARVDDGKCTGCGRCLAQCPQDAISLHARS